MSIEAASRIESRRDVREAEASDARAELVLADPFPSAPERLAPERLDDDCLDAVRPPAPTRLENRFSTPLSIDSARFRRVLETEAGARFSRGNLVTPLVNGPASFTERESLIVDAKHSIHLQTFELNSDVVGKKFAELLAYKASKGIKVRIIYDAFGSFHTEPAMFAMMREAGVELRKRPLAALNHRWHQKHLIVDGKVAITGGMNMGDEYANGGRSYIHQRQVKWGWRDADMRVEGPAVRDYQFAFLRNWAKLGEDVTEEEERELMRAPSPHPRGVDIAVAQSDPKKGELTSTSEMLSYAFAAAKHSLTIETPYLIPPAATLQALRDAAARGVRVRILTPATRATNHPIVNESFEASKQLMLAAGIEIYEAPTMLHEKTVVVDGHVVLIGSANLNGRSHDWDGEIMSTVWDREMAGILERHFNDYVPVTHFVMSEDIGRRSLIRRVLVSLAKPFRSSF